MSSVIKVGLFWCLLSSTITYAVAYTKFNLSTKEYESEIKYETKKLNCNGPNHQRDWLCRNE